MIGNRLAAVFLVAATLPALGQNELVPVDTPTPRKAVGTFCALPAQEVPGVVVPDGFCFRKFANVPTPRVMAFAPNGDLFVSSPKDQTPGGAPPGLGAILVLPDDDRDGSADGILMFTPPSTLSSVHGVAFRPGELLY